jgi:hypothetical protein
MQRSLFLRCNVFCPAPPHISINHQCLNLTPESTITMSSIGMILFQESFGSNIP